MTAAAKRGICGDMRARVHVVPGRGYASEFPPNDKEATDGKLLYGSVSVEERATVALLEIIDDDE